MKTYFELRESLEEKFSFPKPPFKDMHIVGFSGKLKQTQQSGTDENVGPAVLKDVKAALKIVAKHLKTQGMRYKEDEVLVGPMNVKGFKPGKGEKKNEKLKQREYDPITRKHIWWVEKKLPPHSKN